MIKLSVNVNKIATLRNARGGRWPSVAEFSEASIRAGAHGITVHPRPDGRHVRTADVHDLAALTAGRVEFNIEGYPDERYLRLVEEVRPTQATLVPDPPDAITSNAGWDAAGNRSFLVDTVARLKAAGARVSLFMETDRAQLDAAAATGTDRVEFYTEPFATAFDEGRGAESFAVFDAAARHARDLGLGINAGHDLSLHNMVVLRDLAGLAEVSIGHALVHEALWLGWNRTIAAYLEVLGGGAPPGPEAFGRP
jgi:pyridoxine 5-phosphate synthase